MASLNLDTLKKVANTIASAVGKAAGSTGTAKTSGASSSYTPINSYAAQNVDQDAYDEAVKQQQQYINANPSAVRTQSAEEKNDKYGDIISSTARTGYYTKDASAAQAAAEQYGVTVTPTSYNGEDGWYRVDRAERATPSGSSGADEGLLSDSDYAIVQKLKQDFANAQATYNAAVAAGNTAAAAAAQRQMDDAHLEAERIRSGYNYSGGQDGSMYIDYFVNAVNGNMDANTAQTQNLLNAKGISTGSSASGSKSGTGGSTKNNTGGGSQSSSGSGSGSGFSGISGNVEKIPVPAGSDLSGMVEDYSEYLTQMYAAKKEKALAALNAAYQSELAALDREEQGIGEQYQAARNNTAGASEQAKRGFAEYAAASGLNSGTGSQAELARGVTLQNNLNTINTAEADAIADLQLQRAQAETQYNNAIAQAQAEGDYELASALYQEKVRVQDALLDLEIQEQKDALERYQLQYQAQRDAISDQQWAAELARN